jgi:hypothetical protein
LNNNRHLGMCRHVNQFTMDKLLLQISAAIDKQRYLSTGYSC